MRDGCGRGNSLKLLLLGPQRVERDERHAIVGACHRTSNGQEHKIIHRAEPERYDFSLTCHSVQGARQPSSGRSRAEPRPPPGGRSGVKPIARFVLLQNICSPIRLQY